MKSRNVCILEKKNFNAIKISKHYSCEAEKNKLRIKLKIVSLEITYNLKSGDICIWEQHCISINCTLNQYSTEVFTFLTFSP